MLKFEIKIVHDLSCQPILHWDMIIYDMNGVIYKFIILVVSISIIWTVAGSARDQLWW